MNTEHSILLPVPMRLNIQRGIPIPSDHTGVKTGGRYATNPFRFMAVGDSFSVPAHERRRVYSSLNSFVHYRRKKGEKWEFIRRGEAEGNRVRFWRTA